MVKHVTQPPSITPMVDKNGIPTPAWITFFASLVALPPAIEVETVTASPYSYTASGPGNLVVKGGVVTSITVQRGRTTINPGLASGYIPLCQGDEATITYTGLPSVWFIPFQ